MVTNLSKIGKTDTDFTCQKNNNNAIFVSHEKYIPLLIKWSVP